MQERARWRNGTREALILLGKCSHRKELAYIQHFVILQNVAVRLSIKIPHPPPNAMTEHNLLLKSHATAIPSSVLLSLKVGEQDETKQTTTFLYFKMFISFVRQNHGHVNATLCTASIVHSSEILRPISDYHPSPSVPK